LARAVEEQIDLDRLIERAGGAGPLRAGAIRTENESRRAQVRLAVARDEAFQFYYPDFFRTLEDCGCEAVFFSPLRDSALPDGVDGLYLGGGYPEVHAATLAANKAMLEAVRLFCAGGKPVYAECGGLIYLSRGVELDERRHAFAGVLPVRTRMLDRRKALGYVEARLERDSLFGRKGETFRGHEFHYSELIGSPVGVDGWQAVYRLKQKRSGRVLAEGYQRGRVLASYAHLHLGSRPEAVSRFVARMKEQCGPRESGKVRHQTVEEDA
jgi:cobyrinic acid a,c-diamide synthase